MCMRALRFLKGSEGETEVWREWVRVECAFAERVRGRWSVLGIGKGKGGAEEIFRVGEEKEDGMEVDEQESEQVEVPMLDDEGGDDEMKKEVEKEVLSGQEAIIDGAIVRVVIDNCLSCTFASPPRKPRTAKLHLNSPLSLPPRV